MIGDQLTLLQPDSAIQEKHAKTLQDEEVQGSNATCVAQNMNRDLDGLDYKHVKTRDVHAQCCISIHIVA